MILAVHSLQKSPGATAEAHGVSREGLNGDCMVKMTIFHRRNYGVKTPAKLGPSLGRMFQRRYSGDFFERKNGSMNISRLFRC